MTKHHLGNWWSPWFEIDIWMMVNSTCPRARERRSPCNRRLVRKERRKWSSQSGTRTLLSLFCLSDRSSLLSNIENTICYDTSQRQMDSTGTGMAWEQCLGSIQEIYLFIKRQSKAKQAILEDDRCPTRQRLAFIGKRKLCRWVP